MIRVAEGQITLARALCNIVARLERRSWCVLQTFTAPGSSTLIHLRR